MQRTMTHSYEIDSNPENENLILKYLDRYPVLDKAVVASSFDEKVYDYHIIKTGNLIDSINPSYPKDSFDTSTLMALVSGNAHFSVEEYEIFKNILPDYNGQLSVKFRANRSHVRLIFLFSMKKSAVVYKVVFSSNNHNEDASIAGMHFPITVDLTVWEDMDNLHNHHDECPSRLCEDDEDYSDSCDCEAGIAYQGIRVFNDRNTFFNHGEITQWIKISVENKMARFKK